jgi:hypothetical protein
LREYRRSSQKASEFKKRRPRPRMIRSLICLARAQLHKCSVPKRNQTSVVDRQQHQQIVSASENIP